MTRRILFALIPMLAAGALLAWAAGFDHEAHVKEYVDGGDCAACHVAGAPSIIPEIAVCLECHGQEEVGGISLPAPKTHGPLWALNHRAEAKGNAIDCNACHEQSDCLDCHKAGFSHEQGAFTNNMVNVHRSDFHVTHPIAARTDQNLCSSCHEPDYCNECHDRFQMRGSDIGSPSHRRSFELGFDNPDVEAIHAGMNPNTPCDSCHLGSSVAPDFHSWSVGHAREARRSLATCQACHPDGDVCLKCHSARGGVVGFNPHPKDWDKMKGTLQKASNGRTCRKCH